MIEQGAQPPSAVAWNWRRGAGDAAPDRAAAAALRRRGAIQAGVGLVAALILFFLKPPLAFVVAGLAILTLLLALAFPTTGYRQLSRALEAFGHGVGTVVTWILMTLLYFLFFLPAGLLLRAAHKLGITTAPDRRLPSYWTPVSGPERTVDSYRKQF